MYKIAYETFNDLVRFYYKTDGTWTNSRDEAHIFHNWPECNAKLSEINATRTAEEKAFSLDKTVAFLSNASF